MKKIVYTDSDGRQYVVHPAPNARRQILVSNAVYEDVYETRQINTGVVGGDNRSMCHDQRVYVGRREVRPATYRSESDDEFLARVRAKSVPSDATDVRIMDELD